MSMNIQSNAIRGEYMRGIVDKTMAEIHDNIVTVFGPHATDAYLTKEGRPYYTRDGKEVMQSMMFDNELSTYILQIMYQAVHNQGTKIGDGTTTLSVLYANIYTAMRESALVNTSISIVRPAWDAMIKYINATLTEHAITMSDEHLKSSMYTCTQDTQLVHQIYSSLRDAIMDQAFIMINKSNIEDDFVVTVHTEPLFRATKQYSLKPIREKENNCVFLHCNGMLDIANPEIFLSLVSRLLNFNNVEIVPTYVILCNGMTDVTRRTIKNFVTIVKDTIDNNPSVSINELANLAIYTLDDYRSFGPEQIEDLSTIITDYKGIGGLVNAITWESLLYQSFCKGRIDHIESLDNYDHDMSQLTIMEELLSVTCVAMFDSVEGIRIQKHLGPNAQARYDELMHSISVEKSEVKKNDLKRRLRTIYGQFIEVEVGSKLIKDSQRKYELILDAVISSLEGARSGVLITNSILQASKIVSDLYGSHCFTGIKQDILGVLSKAFYMTFRDMVSNVYSVQDLTLDKYYSDYLERDITRFDLKRGESLEDALPKFGTETPEAITTLPDNTKVSTCIVEPVTVMTNLLENSTTAVELALSKTFNMTTYMQNFI